MLENLGTIEILLVVVLILLVLGPDKIPEIARSFAKFARWKASMEEEVRSAINPIMLDHDPPRAPKEPEYPPPPMPEVIPTPPDGDGGIHLVEPEQTEQSDELDIPKPPAESSEEPASAAVAGTDSDKTQS